MRQKIVAGNWKMNKTLQETEELINALQSDYTTTNTEVIIAPAYVNLYRSQELLNSSKINVSAQNMHFETTGAFTGEISAEMLQSIGIARGMVVSGEVGGGGFLDEFSTVGLNHVAEFYQDRGFHESTTSPESFPIEKASIQDLAGGDAIENAGIIRKLLQGNLKGPKLDAVLLNTAAALFS